MHREWKRLFTALVTPFKKDGSLHTEELAKIADYIVNKQKSDGIVVCGTTGESPTLTTEEKLLTLKIVLDTVGDKVPVIFGSGSNNTTESIELSKAAEKTGAHGLMLVSPAYNKPCQEGQFQHFTSIAKQTSLPIMLYNNPGRTAINLDVETLSRIVDICPNVVAFKDSSQDLAKFTKACSSLSDNFLVYSGDDLYTLAMLSAGGHGIVSVASHVVGFAIKEKIEVFFKNPLQAVKIHQILFPVYQSIFSAPSPSPIKYALSREGFDCSHVRLPLIPLPEQNRKLLDQTFTHFQQEISSLISLCC